MKHVEELLHQAQKKEKIVIDQDFKQTLKKSILATPLSEPAYGKNFLWRRLSILLVPALVSLTLFFTFYDTSRQVLPVREQSAPELAADDDKNKYVPAPVSGGADNAVSESFFSQGIKKDADLPTAARPAGTESGILSPLDRPSTASLSSPNATTAGPGTATQPLVVLALLFACLTIMVAGYFILKKKK